MSIDISPDLEARLVAAARAEGVSVEILVRQLIDEREALTDVNPPSLEDVKAKIERGLAQSKRGEVVDGETFMTKLVLELDEIERKRLAG